MLGAALKELKHSSGPGSREEALITPSDTISCNLQRRRPGDSLAKLSQLAGEKGEEGARSAEQTRYRQDTSVLPLTGGEARSPARGPASSQVRGRAVPGGEGAGLIGGSRPVCLAAAGTADAAVFAGSRAPTGRREQKGRLLRRLAAESGWESRVQAPPGSDLQRHRAPIMRPHRPPGAINTSGPA
ncbi:hypothetical protein AAFF_G00394600 [Aldrovandia affinis]|uniref:Uncharacterized protein n=1 Tax=Aldrovandia affinis TaxID=143900 RepID=A0AAD7WKT2_9TELE|nr:hypothetical protein AAFF_G00394600 [Aldrovandia affinis]